MTGELAAFLTFIGLMLLWIGWMMRQGVKAVRKLDEEIAEIERLKKLPP
jgi:hypothetical protein